MGAFYYAPASLRGVLPERRERADDKCSTAFWHFLNTCDLRGAFYALLAGRLRSQRCQPTLSLKNIILFLILVFKIPSNIFFLLGLLKNY